MGATTFLLDLVKELHPEYGGVIDWLEAHPDKVAEVADVAKAAVKEGGAAAAAVKERAPDLYKSIAVLIEGERKTASNPPPAKAENATRVVLGIPKMTPEEEKQWMDRFTPTGDG